MHDGDRGSHLSPPDGIPVVASAREVAQFLGVDRHLDGLERGFPVLHADVGQRLAMILRRPPAEAIGGPGKIGAAEDAGSLFEIALFQGLARMLHLACLDLHLHGKECRE